MQPIHLLPFSPHQPLFVLRPITVEGREYAPGEAFPRGIISDRRMRQLYEQRKISAFAPAFIFNGAPTPAGDDATDEAAPVKGKGSRKRADAA